MLKTLAIAALTVASMTQSCGLGPAGFGGVSGRDLRQLDRLNQIENNKLVRLDNAVDKAVGPGNWGLKNQLKSDLTGIVSQSTAAQTRNILAGNRFDRDRLDIGRFDRDRFGGRC